MSTSWAGRSDSTVATCSLKMTTCSTQPRLVQVVCAPLATSLQQRHEHWKDVSWGHNTPIMHVPAVASGFSCQRGLGVHHGRLALVQCSPTDRSCLRVPSAQPQRRVQPRGTQPWHGRDAQSVVLGATRPSTWFSCSAQLYTCSQCSPSPRQCSPTHLRIRYPHSPKRPAPPGTALPLARARLHKQPTAIARAATATHREPSAMGHADLSSETACWMLLAPDNCAHIHRVAEELHAVISANTSPCRYLASWMRSQQSCALSPIMPWPACNAVRRCLTIGRVGNPILADTPEDLRKEVL